MPSQAYKDVSTALTKGVALILSWQGPHLLFSGQPLISRLQPKQRKVLSFIGPHSFAFKTSF